jgi:4'-phosphopantetheinyl transferase EntD
VAASLKDAFRSFLGQAEDDGWIAGYKWYQAESYTALRHLLGPPGHREGFSRTHKKGNDGTWWALEVEMHDRTGVGVDLEVLMERPILSNPRWITERLGISRSATPKIIIEEWSAREAAFKALYPHNENVFLSQFRRAQGGRYEILTAQGAQSLQVKSAWQQTWVLSLAWRSVVL